MASSGPGAPAWGQIATDKQGRRRFHGAFTGGFSAGFFNTVGSAEGWAPSSFKSSRNERASAKRKARPEDFMDEEDLEVAAVAGTTLVTRAAFSKQAQDDLVGSIVGVERMGLRLLRAIGYKEGEAAGEKIQKERRPKGPMSKAEYERQASQRARQTRGLPRAVRKDNSFGVGYTPAPTEALEAQRHAAAQRHAQARSSGQQSRRGQVKMRSVLEGGAQGSAGLGLGALDTRSSFDDVYSHDCLSNYDIETGRGKKQQDVRREASLQFVRAQQEDVDAMREVKSTAEEPPRTWIAQHRFSEDDSSALVRLKMKFAEQFRRLQQHSALHPLCCRDRGAMLGEQSGVAASAPASAPHLPVPANPTAAFENLTEEHKRKLSAVLARGFSQGEGGKAVPAAAARAARLGGRTSQDFRKAAALKMFGALTREERLWQPHALLCRRFDVPQPTANAMVANESKLVTDTKFQDMLITLRMVGGHRIAGKGGTGGLEGRFAAKTVLAPDRQGVQVQPKGAEEKKEKEVQVEADRKPLLGLFAAIFEDEEEEEDDK